MEPETNLILIATIIMGSLMCGVIFWFHLKFKNEVREKEKALAAYKQGFSKTLQFGENQAMGKIAEQVADLEFYKEYDEVYILAATKGSPPVDRVGVKYEEKILELYLKVEPELFIYEEKPDTEEMHNLKDQLTSQQKTIDHVQTQLNQAFDKKSEQLTAVLDAFGIEKTANYEKALGNLRKKVLDIKDTKN